MEPKVVHPDWHKPGDLTDALNARLDEIYLTGDNDAMKRLDLEMILLFQSWMFQQVRRAKAKGDFKRAVHFHHVASLLQKEAEHARGEYE